MLVAQQKVRDTVTAIGGLGELGDGKVARDFLQHLTRNGRCDTRYCCAGDRMIVDVVAERRDIFAEAIAAQARHCHTAACNPHVLAHLRPTRETESLLTLGRRECTVTWRTEAGFDRRIGGAKAIDRRVTAAL